MKGAFLELLHRNTLDEPLGLVGKEASCLCLTVNTCQKVSGTRLSVIQ